MHETLFMEKAQRERNDMYVCINGSHKFLKLLLTRSFLNIVLTVLYSVTLWLMAVID